MSACGDGVTSPDIEAPEANNASQEATAQTSQSLVRGLRGVVVLLKQFGWKTAEPANQWKTTKNSPERLITQQSGATASDVITINNYTSCADLLGTGIDVTIEHKRHADLRVYADILNPNSLPRPVVMESQLVWDGPAELAKAVAKDPKVADVTMPSSFGLDEMVHRRALLEIAQQRGGQCAKWRLRVVNAAPTPLLSGTFTDWTLRRRIALDPWTRTPSDYKRVFQGPGFPNVVDYFKEQSGGRFWFNLGGIYGPAIDTGYHTRTDKERLAWDVGTLMSQGVDYRTFDVNKNGKIEADELTVVVLDNGSAAEGNARTDCLALPLPNGAKMDGCIGRVWLGAQTNFATLAHELSHTLGTHDLYGSWGSQNLSPGLTLMSGTGGGINHTVALDPWHRAHLGWIRPTPDTLTINANGEGSTFLPYTHSRTKPVVDAAPIRITGEAPGEYYYLEARDGGGYDADFGNTSLAASARAGIVAWHVQEDGRGELFKDDGAPTPEDNIDYGHRTFAVGPGAIPGESNRAWRQEDGLFRLNWYTNDRAHTPTKLRYVFWVEEQAGGQRLHWRRVTTEVAAPVVNLISPLPGSHGTVGPGTGVSFAADATSAIGDNNSLRFVWSLKDGVKWGEGSRFVTPVSNVGRYSFVLSVIDRNGGRTDVETNYTADPAPIQVSFDSPTAGTVLERNRPITYQGGAGSAAIFKYPCERLELGYSIGATWLTVANISQPGDAKCTFRGAIGSLGPLELTMRILDPDTGVYASAAKTFTFVEPAVNVPIVTIDRPTAHYYGDYETPVPLSGSVVDPSTGAQGSYRWTVFNQDANVEYELGAQSSVLWRPLDNVPYSSVASAHLQFRLYGSTASGGTKMVSVPATIYAAPR